MSMLTKGDLNQQAIQRRLLSTIPIGYIEYEKVDVYCSISNNDIVRFVSMMYTRKIEGWWLYNEELIEHNVCTVEQYRESLKQEVRR